MRKASVSAKPPLMIPVSRYGKWGYFDAKDYALNDDLYFILLSC